MSIIMGALGGLGEAVTDIAKSNRKFWDDEELQKQRAEIETNRQMALEKFRENLKAEPLNRIGAKAKVFAEQTVPQEAARPTTLSGFDPRQPEGGGPMQEGFTGSINNVRQLIAKLPAGEEKSMAMAQLQAQLAGEGQFESGIVSGVQRKRTAAEAMQMAADDAAVNDIPAYAAWQREVGKPLRDDRRLDEAERKNEENEKIRTRQLDQQLAQQDKQLAETIRHNKALEKSAELRSDKLSPAAKAQLDIANSGLASAQKEEALAAKLVSDATRSNEMDPEKKAKDIASAKAEYAAAKTGVAMAMEHYNKVGKAHLGAEWMDIAQSVPAPVKQDVIVAGKVIGQATTREEAQQMRDAFVAKTTQKPAAEPAQKAPPAEPSSAAGNWSNAVSGRGASAPKKPAEQPAFAKPSKPPAGPATGDRALELQDRIKELKDAKARYAKSKSDTRAIDQAIEAAEQELNGR